MRPALIIRQIKRLASNRDGNVLMLFALCLPVIILALGAAVDFSRGSDAHVKMQTALDAAVLAGAKALSDGEADAATVEAIAQAAFEANIADSLGSFSSTPTITLTVDMQEGVLEAYGNAEFAHAFSVLGDDDSSQVGGYSQAGFNVLDIEMALMLDVTGSMEGQKVEDLKDASTAVIDMMIGEGGSASTSNTTRISLVPYSAAVNAGDFAETASGGASADCVVERTGPHSDDDLAPGSAPVGTSPAAYCPDSEIMALSDDAEDLKDRIEDMSTGGCTAGHIGVAWSYYTLSPNWSGVFPSESAPAAYGAQNTLKVALLMTDGEFNTYYDGMSDPTCSEPAKTASRNLTLDLCDAMRADGIVVYSVAYQAPSDAELMLRQCAEDPDKYFETNTGPELIAAFQEIADEVRNLRLTR